MSAAARLAVLASGSGTNLQAILDACASGVLPAEVVVVVSDRPDAIALQRAARAGIPAVTVVRRPGESRPDYDRRLAIAVSEHDPDWVVLAGWMRLLTTTFLGRHPERVVNLHPALPGELPGLHAIERAHAEGAAGLRDHTGVMVHLVPDEGVDDGPVLDLAVVAIEPGDTLDDLRRRVQAAEHVLLVRTLGRLLTATPPLTTTTILEESHVPTRLA